MTRPPVAKAAFLTQPAPGRYVLNLTFAQDQPRVIDVLTDGTRHERVEVTEQQIQLFVSDGAAFAFRKGAV